MGEHPAETQEVRVPFSRKTFARLGVVVLVGFLGLVYYYLLVGP